MWVWSCTCVINSSRSRDVEEDSPARGIKPPIRQQSSPVSLNTVTTTPTSPRIPVDVDSALLNKVVSKNAILDLVGESSALSNWRFIGRRLGFDDTTIVMLENDHPNNLREQCYQMMLKWMQKDGDQATYLKLIQAFEKNNLKDLSDMVKRNLVDWQSDN